MKKEKINIVLIIALIIFTTAVVPKTFQNDTYFAIAVGDLILDNGIDMMEHFTWHEGLTYCYSHWLFDIIISIINSFWGFTGIYIFVIIMANVTSITLYSVLRKRKNNIFVSFIVTLFTIYIGYTMFTGRAQIISFVLFILEVFCIEQFLDNPKKRYVIGLLIIPIIIANVHAAVWPIYFIMYLPYIAEYILSQWNIQKKYERKKEKAIKKLENPNITEKQKYKNEQIIIKADNLNKNKEKIHKPYKILIEENENTKKLIIIMILAILTGFITPIGDTPFTYLIKQMQNKIVSSFISEMQPIVPLRTYTFIILMIVYIALIAFTDTKIKLSDGLLLAGFIFLTLLSVRSLYYMIWICAIPLARILNSFITKYGQNELNTLNNKLSTKKFKVSLIIIICIWSVYCYTNINLNTSFVDKERDPVEASEYILNNLDINNIRLYNGYDYGSYLEMKGIPVFIDSRADVWCSEFNDTTVLEDERDLNLGYKTYSEIFEKYDITHVLVNKDILLENYLSEDENYHVIYSDEYFVLYQNY